VVAIVTTAAERGTVVTQPLLPPVEPPLTSYDAHDTIIKHLALLDKHQYFS